MKSNNTFQTLVLPGVLAALLLAGCGGGGGGGGGGTPPPPVVTEMPSFVITNAEAVTASVKVSNTTGAALNSVQVLVSTLKDSDATSDDAISVKIKDVILYNSTEDAASALEITAGGNVTFSLKNVSFAAASTDADSSASMAVCANTSDKALGEVRLEVFSDGGRLLERDVPVCALQGKTYEVIVSN